MPMRRFRRRFKRARTPVSWVSTLFSETAIAANATADSTQVLLDSVDWNANIASTRKLAHIQRIVYTGVVGIVTLSTTFSSEFLSIIWAMVIADANDTDEMGNTAAGGLLQSNRVLASGVVGGTFHEIAAGTTIDFTPGMRVEVDTRLRARVQPDEQLQMRYRFQSDATSVVSVAAVSAFSRILISEP